MGFELRDWQKRSFYSESVHIQVPFDNLSLSAPGLMSML